MAFQAGSGREVNRMTVTAGCTFMIEAVLVTAGGGMRPVEGGGAPTRGVVALVARDARE